jgi:RND family efflux transporter MFP subunit
MQHLNFWKAGALALSISLAVGCKRDEAAKPMDRPTATAVTVAPVRVVPWDRTVSIIGNLYPKDSATIGAEVDGTVERTLVDFGDRVKEGQDLAFIDTASYEALLEQSVGNLAKAEATLINAQQNFARWEELKRTGIASASDYDQGKAQLDQAKAEVQAVKGAQVVAQLNLARYKVKAPFDGAIAQRIVGKGDYVKIAAPLFEIVNDAVLKFIFQVPERYGSFVDKKLPVSFNVDNYPGETFTGSVYLISPSVTTSSRAFGVGALVTNTNFRLKANTFGRGSLVLQKDVPTTVVPLEAVVSFAGVTKVFIVENNLAHSRQVKAGRIQDGLQEIIEGLKEGETVIVTGQNRLSDGAAVTLQTPVPGSGDGPTDSSRKEAHEKHSVHATRTGG